MLKAKSKEEKQIIKAEERVLKDIFDDMYSRRGRVYKMSFFRGLWFGLGSVLGGTIVLAVVIWMLSLFVNIPGWIGEFVRWIVEIIQKS